jgi:hypothetical protein
MLWAGGKGVWPIEAKGRHVTQMETVEQLCSKIDGGSSGFLLEVRAFRALANGGASTLEEVTALWKEAAPVGNLTLELLLGGDALNKASALVDQTRDLITSRQKELQKQPGKLSEDAAIEELVAGVKTAVGVWKEWHACVSKCLRALDRGLKGRNEGDDQRVLAGIERFFEVGPSDSPGTRVVEETSAGWCTGVILTHLPNQGLRGEISTISFRKEASKFLRGAVVEAGKVYRALLEGVVSLLTPDAVLPSLSWGGNCIEDRVQIWIRLFQLAESVPECMLKISATTWGFSPTPQGLFSRKLWECLLPRAASAEDARDTVRLREDPHVRAVLTWLADVISTGQSPVNFRESGLVSESVRVSWNVQSGMGNQGVETRQVLSHEAVGQLQLLLPFLDPDWFENSRRQGKFDKRLHVIAPMGFPEELRLRALRFGASWEIAATTSLQRPNWGGPIDPLTSVYAALYNGRALVDLFGLDWERTEGYANPFTFVRLAERAVVQSCAAVSQLNHLVLPTTWVLEHMGGPAQGSLYTLLLRFGCHGAQRYQLQGLLAQLLDMGIPLLAVRRELGAWIGKAGLDRAKNEPLLVMRLLVLVLTLTVNPQVDLDRRFLTALAPALNLLVQNNSPILGGLPLPVLGALRSLGSSSGLIRVSDFGSTLGRVLAAAGDSLTVLQRKGWFLPHAKRPDFHWASKLRRVNVSVDGDGGKTFSIQALLPSSQDAKLVEDWARSNSVLLKEVSKETEAPKELESEPADDEEAVGGVEGLESDGLRTESTEDRTADQPAAVPAGVATLTLADHVPKYMQERLAFLLVRARARIVEDRNLQGRLANEARRVFARQQVTCPRDQSAAYHASFRREACALQVRHGELPFSFIQNPFFRSLVSDG